MALSAVLPCFSLPIPVLPPKCPSLRLKAHGDFQTIAMSRIFSESKNTGVCVVGAGIIGLTTAYRLAERKINVAILARDTIHSAAPDSAVTKPYTSSGAGGFWWPFHIEPEVKVSEWATTTYNSFKIQMDENCGLSVHDAYILQATATSSFPWYTKLTNLEFVTPAQDHCVPKNYKGAFRFKTVMVYMEVYLSWLHAKLESMNNVTIYTNIPHGKGDDEWSFNNIKAFMHDYIRTDILVNCAGLGAGTFSNDDKIYPGRGVILIGRRTKEHDDFNYSITETEEDGLVTRDGKLAYCFPRGSDLITMGGTFEEGSCSLTAQDEEIDGVRHRVEQIVPSLKYIEEVTRWSGLRPCRHSGVRIELECRDDIGLRIIHNYGHGGGGVTTCWGCASEAASLVTETMGNEM